MKRVLSFTSLAAIGALIGSAAAEPIDEKRPANPDARVSIENLGGSVTVVGWDRHEVSVSGTLASDAEGFDFSGSDSRLKFEVEFPRRARNLDDTESYLEVKVPNGCRLLVNGVNTTISVDDVSGRLELETVNGEITVAGEPERIEATSVNGDIEIEAKSFDVEAGAVSGDIILRDVAGDVAASTVSGDIEVSGGEFDSAEFSSVSGAIEFDGDPGKSSSLEFECHSGSIILTLPAMLSAEVELSTFSGSIESDFGPRPKRKSRYAPGEEVEFTVGDGDARISASNFSGTIRVRER